MIDLRNVEKYRENNRIEAKKALGGLPDSIWETYSAFANTLGGVILLGVEEYKDKTFHVVDLPAPESMIKKFKEKLSDRKKVSVNILSDEDITIGKFEGKRFIAINVPRAHRFDKPIFVDGSVYGGTYRRGGEGDYRCTKEEIDGMKRDAQKISADMILFEEMEETDLMMSTVEKYCEKVKKLRPAYFDEILKNNGNILEKIGAMSKGKDGKYHPTGAGLLMFGKKECIIKKYPCFAPEYIEKNEDNENVAKFEGENLFEFYLIAEKRISRSVCMLGMNRSEEKTVSSAIGEALANSLIHADYHSECPISVELCPYSLSLINPGSLRVSPDDILHGGVSDRRNAVIAKILYLVGIGSGGIRGIYEVWRRKKWCAPVLGELFSPERVRLLLVFGSAIEDSVSTSVETLSRKDAIINYVTENIEVTSRDIASLLGVSCENALSMLKKLADDKILIFEKRGNVYYYKLKS